MARLDWSRLHSKILRSSLFTREDPMTRLVFLCAVADSESDGSLFGSIPALARAWNLKDEQVETAMKRLQQPDPESSTPDENGRRILRLGPNEWLVTTKTVHNPRAHVEPPGASTERVRKHRASKKIEDETDETVVSHGTHNETHETDVTHETTGNSGNDRNTLEERRGEEKRGIPPSSSGVPSEDTPPHGGGARRFRPPDLPEVIAYARESVPGLRAEAFWMHYQSVGWKVGRNPMKDWHAAARGWALRDGAPQSPKVVIHKNAGDLDREREADEIARNRDAATRARSEREAEGTLHLPPMTPTEIAEEAAELAELERRLSTFTSKP